MIFMTVHKMAPIATYVFLDIETTGIPQEEFNKTKITELSLIAITRSQLLMTKYGDSLRIQQTLTLCFNPRRMVHPENTKITGLCNNLLEHESPFNKAALDTIKSFLSILSKPVCLIAQNGITFDFPILKKHLDDLGENFADDLLCADCLHFFYDIDIKSDKILPSVDLEEINLQENITDELDLILHQEVNDMQSKNESTPKKSENSSTSMIDFTRNHKFIIAPKKLTEVRRKLFYNDNPKPQISYKLSHIYERYLKLCAIDAHRAECDCIMALECSVAKAEKFVQWVDNNHCLFADVKSMAVGVPLGY